MTDTPWTPGPWRVGGPAPQPWVFVNGEGAAWVANYHHPTDARLIAAAPEMAELLAEAAEHGGGMVGDGITDNMPILDWRVRSNALLNRIRGEDR